MDSIGIVEFAELFSILSRNVDWKSLDPNIISFYRNPLFGWYFTEFLRCQGKFSFKDYNIIPIIRGHFSTNFIGLTARVDDKLSDVSSGDIKEIDIRKVELRRLIKHGETYVTGKQSLGRIKEEDSSIIFLDVCVFYMFWTNQHLIPDSWKIEDGVNIAFPGTIFEEKDYPFSKFFLALKLEKNNVWSYGKIGLNNSVHDYSLVAVLKV